MALGDKERAASLIPSMASTTATAALTMPIKAIILKIFKSESFSDFKYKFKAFCIQVRLNI
jgi:hypothetical protein